MTKDETYLLKGVAILMMIWTHLFSNETLLDRFTPLLYAWNGDAVAYVPRKVCSMCVPIFTVLGGYGLAATYQKSANTKNGRRVLNLMMNFWFVCAIYI